MKTRRRSLLSTLVVGIALMALLPASSALAVPHEQVTNPHTTCFVDGEMTITGPKGGVTLNPADNHYRFVDTALRCTGRFEDAFKVVAHGCTTDYYHQGDGEDYTQGGSVKGTVAGHDEDGCLDPVTDDHAGSHVDDEFHTGVLDAVGSVHTLYGSVHFVRLGNVVLADGPLTDQNGGEHYFSSVLLFVPTTAAPVSHALLIGDAYISGGHLHDCFTDADKHADADHCH